MNDQQRLIKALSEIVLRVRNLKVMEEFYENILGLELFERFDNIVFFRVASGLYPPSQFLVLFEQSAGSDHKTRHCTGLDIVKTTLHHFAFAILQSDYETAYDRLKGLGLDV